MKKSDISKHFRFVEAVDPNCEDSEYHLISNPDISIQVCLMGGGFCVNQWVEIERDGEKKKGMMDHGWFKTLSKAADIAISL